MCGLCQVSNLLSLKGDSRPEDECGGFFAGAQVSSGRFFFLAGYGASIVSFAVRSFGGW